jgi:osmotically inducible protein OsmC
MPRIERTAEIGWSGNLARGEGTLSAGSGAFGGLGYALPTRIAQVDGKTSPEEMLAAAHGGCITMGLAGELTGAGTPPGRLDVTCRIVMDEIEGEGHQIVGSVIEIVAAVDGIDEAAFQELVVKADDGCPFTIMLKKAGADVTVSARLAE